MASSSAAWVRGGVRLSSSASSRLVNTGPFWKRKLRWPVPWSSSSSSVPRMSLGIRSGVNCTRRKSSARAWPRVRTSRVLPSPGTPSSMQWPPASSAARSCSTTSAWPTTARPMASRRRTRCPAMSSMSASVKRSLIAGFRGSRCQRVDDDVDRELRVVLGQEALVAPVVVPFAAVVLVAVEHPEATVDLDALEVVVHQVVAPAVELVAGGGRAVGEAEEAVVQRVVVGQLVQRIGAEDRRHLRLEGPGEQAVDVVVAVVDEHEAAVADVALEVAALGRIEFHQLVPGQVAERRRQHARIGQVQDLLLRIHPQVG